MARFFVALSLTLRPFDNMLISNLTTTRRARPPAKASAKLKAMQLQKALKTKTFGTFGDDDIGYVNPQRAQNRRRWADYY